MTEVELAGCETESGTRMGPIKSALSSKPAVAGVSSSP
jgi:hypothetical protein